MAKKPTAEKPEAKEPKRKNMPEDKPKSALGKKITKAVAGGIALGTALWLGGSIATAVVVGLPATTPLACFGIGFVAPISIELAK